VLNGVDRLAALTRLSLRQHTGDGPTSSAPGALRSRMSAKPHRCAPLRKAFCSEARMTECGLLVPLIGSFSGD
jgi:hypothetical protein